MKRFPNILHKIYLYSIGIWWIILFIYLRFVRERFGYDLNDIKSHVSEEFIYANIAFILLHLFLIIISLYNIMKNYTNYNKYSNNKIIEKISLFINTIVTKPLESIRDLISPLIPGSGLFYDKVARFIEINIELRSKMLVTVFYFIPRLIIAFIFFIELIFYNKIEYFIYSIFLFIIPLGWILFVNLFTDFGERGMHDVQKNVRVIGSGDLLGGIVYSHYKFQPLPQFTYEEGELKEWADTWFAVLNIYVFGQMYLKSFKNTISPYFLLLTSSLYFSAAVYRLYFLLF